jgi:hypothetical protein
MSEHTKQFIDSLVEKDYLKARESLQSAVSDTITKSVDEKKDIIRKSYSDE